MPLSLLPRALRSCFPLLALSAWTAQAADPVEFSVDSFTRVQAGMGVDYVRRDGSGEPDLVAVDQRRNNESTDMGPRYRLVLPLGERWQLGGEYFSISGIDSGVIKKRITLGPFHPFILSNSTDRYDLNVYRVWAGWALYRNDSSAMWLTGGAVIMPTTLTAESPVLARDSVSGVVPLPMLGLRLSHRDAFRLKWSLSVDYAASPVREIGGGMRSLDISVEYPLASWVGVGLGYKAHRLQLDTQRADRDIAVSHSLSSPYFFLTARF
jgi:hypothetical protein